MSADEPRNIQDIALKTLKIWASDYQLPDILPSEAEKLQLFELQYWNVF